jgi:hypothetical protein
LSLAEKPFTAEYAEIAEIAEKMRAKTFTTEGTEDHRVFISYFSASRHLGD